MALNNIRGALLEYFNPLVQIKRFRGKINIQRPKPVHFERAVYLELTKPYYQKKNKGKSQIELCSKYTEKQKEDIENPFQKIIAGELRELFNSSKFIAFYHMNPMKSDQQFKANVMFKKEKMFFKSYGKKTLEMALKDTKYEPVLDFYTSRNVTVFSPQPEIKKILKISKKFPQIVLLAALYEGTLINKDDIMKLSLIHNLQSAQASLVQTLYSAGSVLSQQLTTHQHTLVSNLQERMNQLEEKK